MVPTLDEAMKDQNPYSYVRLDSSLYKDLRYISKSAFGFDPGEEYYRKKNETSKLGEPFLGYIAYSNSGEPSAFYGVYAHPVEYEGKHYIAAQSGDTMTHKAHTGKGLFTELAKLTYALAKEKGIQFIFGFPNKNSYPGFVKKLSWQCPGTLKEYRKKVFTFPLVKFAKKFALLRFPYNLYTSFIFSFFNSPKDIFKNSVLESGVAGITRNSDFIQYKKFSGSRLISINGFSVWLKVDGMLQIGDVERSANKDFDRFLQKLKRIAFLIGADTIVFQTSPETWWDKYLSERCVPVESLSFGFLDLGFHFPLEKLKFVGADADTF
ncbi:MAG: GNAT family N-acetyltransferase [Bacteroidia bacterium]|nr:GNAT family N-acetyltransferase [Bacteroidia bacterium]